MGLLNEFNKTNRLIRALKTTFLVVIFKKRMSWRYKRCYKPINLVGSICKILVDVLANRLKMVLNNKISKTQYAFPKGRQILDKTLVSIEVLGGMKWRREAGILC